MVSVAQSPRVTCVQGVHRENSASASLIFCRASNYAIIDRFENPTKVGYSVKIVPNCDLGVADFQLEVLGRIHKKWQLLFLGFCLHLYTAVCIKNVSKSLKKANAFFMNTAQCGRHRP